MLRKWDIFILTVFLNCCILCQTNFVQAATQKNDSFFWTGVGKQAVQEAWKLLGSKPERLLILTNAGYAVVNQQTTEACLDGLAETTGCTRANLLDVHSAREKTLWFLFFDKDSGNSAYMEFDSTKIGEQREVFTYAVTANIGEKYLDANAIEWNEKLKTKIFHGHEFAIVTFCNAVAKGAPYDFIKAALYHDHLCPGVSSGYLLANYLTKELPLRSDDERYYVIAIPTWCKEDALQTLLNTTPGKGGMAVLPIDEEIKNRLVPAAKNLAGIYIRWNNKTKTGSGIVLGFDFGKGAAMSGIDMKKNFPWQSKLKLDLWYTGYYDKPEIFINTIKTFELATGEKPEDFALAGVNPLEKLQLLQ